MNKLGLVIKVTDGGETEHSSFNKDPNWSEYLDDARNYIGNLQGFDGTGKFALFLKFLGKNGYMVCIVKARPAGSGRASDNTSAWINVPFNLVFSPEELISVVDKVCAIISDNYQIDTNALEQIFSKEYPVKDVFNAVRKIGSAGSELAVRYYGGNTGVVLKDLLGDFIAQKDYSRFMAIGLIDKESGITFNGKCLSQPPLKVCTIVNPVNSDGYTPVLVNQKKTLVFSKPVERAEGESIKVVWKRDGMVDVEKDYTVKREDDGTSPGKIQISPSEYVRIIQKSWFDISTTIEGERRKLEDCRIKINGKTFENEVLNVSEDAYQAGLKVEIEKDTDDYEYRFSQTCRLANEKERIIEIKPTTMNYKFLLKSRVKGEEETDEVNVNIDVPSHIKLKKSPIKGYVLQEDITGDKKTYELKYNNAGVKSFFVGFAAAIVLLALVWAVFNVIVNGFAFGSWWPLA